MLAHSWQEAEPEHSRQHLLCSLELGNIRRDGESLEKSEISWDYAWAWTTGGWERKAQDSWSS